MDFLNDFLLLLKARYPIIYINTYEEETLQFVKGMRDADKFFSKIKKIDIEDNIDNCFSIKGFIETKNNDKKETYFQKIFCKKSPLLDPLKIIMNTKESKL